MNWSDLKYTTGPGLAIGFMNLFNKDPAKEANKYLKQIPGTVKPYYNPFIQSGQRQLPQLEEQYGNLVSNPGDILSKIGSGYQKSPGFDFAMQQALQGAHHAAAAGGMAGSPAAQQESMSLAGNLANRDYQDYIKEALGLYGTGLAGEQGLATSGMNMSDQLAKLLAGTLGSQASAGYAGAANRNMMNLGTLGQFMQFAKSAFSGGMGGK